MLVNGWVFLCYAVHATTEAATAMLKIASCPCTFPGQINQIKPSHSTDDDTHTNTTSTTDQNTIFIPKLKLNHNVTNNNNNNNKTKSLKSCLHFLTVSKCTPNCNTALHKLLAPPKMLKLVSHKIKGKLWTKMQKETNIAYHNSFYYWSPFV